MDSYTTTQDLFLFIRAEPSLGSVVFALLSWFFPLKDNARVEGEAGALKLDVNTFRGDLELAALGDLDRLGRLVTCALLAVLDLLHDVVALKDLAEDDVASVKPPVEQTSLDRVQKRLGREATETYEVMTVVMKN